MNTNLDSIATPLLDGIKAVARQDDLTGRLYDVLREAIRQYKARTEEAISDARAIQRSMDRTIESLQNGGHCSSDGVGNSRDSLTRALALRAAAVDEIVRMCYALDIPSPTLFAEIDGSM